MPDRREFLAAAGAFGLTVLSRGALGANERIGVGVIGVGGLGRGWHLRHLLGRPEFEVLAVCDVDQRHIDASLELARRKIGTYRDYRRLLDRTDIDAVLIATPDHWHALIAIHACEAGKDVYCEKPLTLTVAEGRAMVEAARRYGRVFQTGSQQRSDRRFRWACELVRNGRIGKLERVRTCLGPGPAGGWEEVRKPPKSLDWDFWLGPAPRAPYTPKRCHYTFRWLYDYSGGKMTDWGAHHNDIAQWGIGTDLGGPVEVEGRGVFPEDGLFDTPVHFDVHYRYANGVRLHCTSRGRNGVTFFGSEGKVFVARGAISADPVEILETPPGAGPVLLYESGHHHTNWVDCIRSRERCICDVEIGHRSVTVCHLGNIAMRLGRKLAWDPLSERFSGDAEANRLLSKPMRKPWSL